MQPFVSFSVVLTCERFTTDRTDKRALVGVGSEVGTEVVCACEALRAETTLEGSGVFLDAVCLTLGRCGGARGIGEIENIVSRRVNRGCGGAALVYAAGWPRGGIAGDGKTGR